MKIDAEFQSLIPPLTYEEKKMLEESILSEGCRDAIVVWNDTIIDGHNRYEICKKHGIPFETVISQQKPLDDYKPTTKNEMEACMERKLYLELCQRQAIKGGVMVEYDSIAYQPYAYELKFQPDGKIKHTAILKEPKANCLVYCRLEDVKEK